MSDDYEKFKYNDECEHEYDRKKDFNNYKFNLLLEHILYYRENKEQEDLNKALELFKSISPEHEGIDKEYYNIATCALATEFAQLDGVENLKTSLELYNTISTDTTGIKIENLIC